MNYDMNDSPDSTYFRPCVCSDEDKIDFPKSFCYVEGTDGDKTTAENVEELSENVWYESKPPRMFKSEVKPLVTARQVQITRVIMNGACCRLIGTEIEEPKEKVFVNILKKRSAKKILSNTRIDD